MLGVILTKNGIDLKSDEIGPSKTHLFCLFFLYLNLFPLITLWEADTQPRGRTSSGRILLDPDETVSETFEQAKDMIWMELSSDIEKVTIPKDMVFLSTKFW